MRQVPGKGRGVFATKPFGPNEFVVEYKGDIISNKEAKQRESVYSMDPRYGCYMYYFEYKNRKLW